MPTESVKYERLEYVDESGFHEIIPEEKGKATKPGEKTESQKRHRWVKLTKGKGDTDQNEISDTKGK